MTSAIAAAVAARCNAHRLIRSATAHRAGMACATIESMAHAKEILEAAMKLDPRQREHLADALWDSLEHGDDALTLEKAWEEEIARRCKEIDEGKAEFVEWSVVKAEIAKRLGEK
jgi:putative addiction module component (TIGR02574 family)